MSDHTKAIVPLEAWCYSSPALRAAGVSVDVGVFLEALLYYETVAVNITNQPQFAEFLRWFQERDQLDDLLALVQDGTVEFYHYAFMTTAILDERTGDYMIWNMQDKIQAKQDTFEQRFLYHESIRTLFPKARHRSKLYQTFRDRVIEVKSSEFGKSIDNARNDFQDPHRSALVVQAFVDELYRFRSLGRPPEIEASIDTVGAKHRITYNVDFLKLAELAGPTLSFSKATPITGAAHSNRLIWSAAMLSCDLYLSQPMGMLVGDKLYESTEQVAKAGSIIDNLKEEVEFPDVQALVNSRKLDLKDVLKIRAKSRKFRMWLQQEADRDRNSIIAYHNETAKELGLVSAGRKALGIFGVIGGGAIGSIVGGTVAGPAGGALGGAAGSATGYLTDLVAKMGADWKPVVFGNWMRDRIQKIVN